MMLMLVVASAASLAWQHAPAAAQVIPVTTGANCSTADPDPAKAEACRASLRGMAARRRPPLLRIERAQLCLRALGLYNGAINGRRTNSTVRALGRFANTHDLASPAFDANPFKQRAVQVKLVEVCRPVLALADRDRADDPATRCGTAAAYSRAAKACTCIDGHERDYGLCLPVTRESRSNRQADSETGKATSTPAVADPPPGEPVCLSQELKGMLARGRSSRPDLAVCELPCLAPLTEPKSREPRPGEIRSGVNWCRGCVRFSGYLALDDILRIEKAGNLTLCREAAKSLTGADPGLEPPAHSLKGARALFSTRLAAAPHRNVAVIIGNQRYQQAGAAAAPGVPGHGTRDASAMAVLLTERLGYQHQNVIEIKDAALADFERVFGTQQKLKGALWDLINGASAEPSVSVLVYFSGLGTVRLELGDAFLLPVDAKAGREASTAYPLALMIENLGRLGAASVAVLLESDFSRDPGRMMFSPNAPQLQSPLLPNGLKPGVTLMTAADRDQRTLEDPEYGLGLFTRHLIEGLSGAADAPPIGNNDRNVDMIELYVHVAHKVGVVARKSFGIMQKPVLLQPQPLVIARFGAVRK